eukprot:2743898-Rhodomonas_salina.1
MTRTTNNVMLWSWHKTSGCINTKYLMRVASWCKGMEEVAKLPKCTTIPDCYACLRGKAHHHLPPKKQQSHRYSKCRTHPMSNKVDVQRVVVQRGSTR